MHKRKARASLARAAVGGALMLLAALPALAQSARVALVVGNSGYTAFPALPACLESSRALATTLRGLDYRVVERQEVTSGGLAAAIDEFSKAMESAPGASVLVYVCGYAAGMNDRPFLLPVSARILRPSDVMTQGLLTKAMLDTLVRGNASRGLLALDLVPATGVPAPVLDTLGTLPAPDGLGVIVIAAAQPSDGSTALSAALTAALAAPDLSAAGLLTDVKTRLGKGPATPIALLRMPEVARPLAGDPQPPPAPVQPEPTAPILPLPTGPAGAFPDEAAMTEGDRRRVQEGLARLGYYGARIDGRFGPETRAAIRRLQHEIGAPMTGTITGEQAARLVAPR
jgi:hypothetical protein